MVGEMLGGCQKCLFILLRCNLMDQQIRTMLDSLTYVKSSTCSLLITERMWAWSFNQILTLLILVVSITTINSTLGLGWRDGLSINSTKKISLILVLFIKTTRLRGIKS